MARWLEYLPAAELQPADRNARRHDLLDLQQKMARFGYMDPVVLDERTGKMVGGHGRTETLLAAQLAGLAPPEGIELNEQGEWLVPVFRGWASADDVEAEAANVALNPPMHDPGYDDELLAAILADVDAGSGLVGTGYDRADLDDLLARMQENDEPVLIEHLPMDPDMPYGDHGAPSERKPSREEKFDQYYNKALRSFVLEYPVDEYEALAKRASTVREQRGLPSNAAVFAALLEEAAP